MKKIINMLFICIISLILTAGGVLPALATEPPDPERASSLTLQYKYDEELFEGLEVNIYRIAELFSDGTYELFGAFANYPVSIHGVSSRSEWSDITSTLAAYVAADSIVPDKIGTTDENGRVCFDGIMPGIYMTLSVKSESEGTITVFEDFLTVIPQLNDDDSYSYDVTAYPKSETYTPKPQETEYKVVKQWKDKGYEQKRPEFVWVDIIKDGAVHSTQKLSEDNNWCYSWKAPDDGSKWTAVERNIPEEYTVTVTVNGNTMIITNATDHGETDPPQTGYTFEVWPYVVAMSVSGGLMILVGIWRKRSEL